MNSLLLSFRFSSIYIVVLLCSIFTYSSCDYNSDKISLIDYEIREPRREQLFFPENSDYTILFPDEPISLMKSWESSFIWDNALLNYYSILKINDALYYMYYNCLGKDDTFQDQDQHLCFAFSTDGIHWEKRFPSGTVYNEYQDTNILFYSNMIEFQVFCVEDLEYPYRIIGNQDINGDKTLIMMKSKDAISFDEKTKAVLSKHHDTQVSCIVEDSIINIYLRLNNNGYRNVGVMSCDLNGRVLKDPTVFISYPYCYQASASSLSDSLEVFFPTLFDNKNGDDNMSVSCFLYNKHSLTQSIVDFERLLMPNELSVYVCPGICEIGGNLYISYAVRHTSHDKCTQLASLESEYKMARFIIARKQESF